MTKSKSINAPRGCTLQEKLDWYSQRMPPDKFKKGCLLWTGAIFKPYGHGNIVWEGHNQVVSRLVWETAKGPLPPGKFALHRCDTPACFEITHLYAGTKKRNTMDSVERGRHVDNKGPANGRVVLTPDQVLRIFRDRRTNAAVAYDYPVSTAQVSKIKTGRSWGHLTGKEL